MTKIRENWTRKLEIMGRYNTALFLCTGHYGIAHVIWIMDQKRGGKTPTVVHLPMHNHIQCIHLQLCSKNTHWAKHRPIITHQLTFNVSPGAPETLPKWAKRLVFKPKHCGSSASPPFNYVYHKGIPELHNKVKTTTIWI